MLVPILAILSAGCTRSTRPAAIPASGAQGPPPAVGAPGGRASIGLDLVAFQIIPTGTAFPVLGELELGGLSSCVLDLQRQVLLAISDGRAASAFFHFAIELGMGGLRVEPTGATRLETAAENPRAPPTLDFEGITLVGGTRLIVSSEGDGERYPPAILEYERSGRFVRALPLPATFLPDPRGRQARGMRVNEALEPITSLADGRIVIGAEGPLLQDDKGADFDRGAWTRLLELVPSGDTWRPGRQFAYPLAPVKPRAGFTSPAASAGLVDLLPLEGDRLLAMERSFVRDVTSGVRTANDVRIFEISLTPAEDISGVESLRTLRTLRGVSKALVADIADFAPRLGPKLKDLENFEGMCFGPVLPDGSRSLLVLSDNNFSESQRTAFLLFRVEEK